MLEEDVKRWQIGNVVVTRLVELKSSTIGRYILPMASQEEMDQLDWIDPFLDEQRQLVLSFHSLIVQTPQRLIVVDTCIGNEKERNYPRWNRMQTSFLRDFEALGFNLRDVDTVLCTHMHVDHVGWNTYLSDNQWIPTFLNARYLYAQEEWQHWQSSGEGEDGPILEDSVKPIFDAGLADLVPGQFEVCDEVQLFPTHGHTPGHVSVHIRSAGEEAVITGDVFHHPCQFAHPNWSATADLDEEQARQTRWDFLKSYVDRPVLVIGTHFAGPTAGRIVAAGDVYRLDY